MLRKKKNIPIAKLKHASVLHLGNANNGDGNALASVNSRTLDLKRHGIQTQPTKAAAAEHTRNARQGRNTRARQRLRLYTARINKTAADFSKTVGPTWQRTTSQQETARHCSKRGDELRQKSTPVPARHKLTGKNFQRFHQCSADDGYKHS
jgi:hypothetical protein